MILPFVSSILIFFISGVKQRELSQPSEKKLQRKHRRSGTFIMLPYLSDFLALQKGSEAMHGWANCANTTDCDETCE